MQSNPAPAADAATSQPMKPPQQRTSRLRASLHWLRQHFVSRCRARGKRLRGEFDGVLTGPRAFRVSTNDAYVQADSTIVASRVSGYVSAVLIQDDQPSRPARYWRALTTGTCARPWIRRARGAGQSGRRGHPAGTTREQSTLIVKTPRDVCFESGGIGLGGSQSRAANRKMAGIGFGSEQQSQEADAQARERSADLTREQAGLATERRQVEVCWRSSPGPRPGATARRPSSSALLSI